jgi:hypothetical protein
MLRLRGGGVAPTALRVDGARAQTEVELSLEPERVHAIELRAEQSRVLVVRFLRLPRGHRTELALDALRPQPDDGRLNLPAGLGRLRALSLNGQPLGEIESLASLSLRPGNYELEIQPVGGTLARVHLELSPEEDRILDLGRAAASETAHVEAAAAPAPSPSWPTFALFGTAGAAAAGAAALYYSATLDASEFYNQPKLPGQPMTFASFTAGQAQPIKDRYRDKMIAVDLLSSAAVAALVGGVLWLVAGSP